MNITSTLNQIQILLDQLLDILNLNSSQTQETKNNLNLAIKTTFFEQVVTDPLFQTKLETLKNRKFSDSEFEQFKLEIQNMANTIDNDLDINHHLVASATQVINSFISEMKPSLPPQQFDTINQLVNDFFLRNKIQS